MVDPNARYGNVGWGRCEAYPVFAESIHAGIAHTGAIRFVVTLDFTLPNNLGIFSCVQSPLLTVIARDKARLPEINSGLKRIAIAFDLFRILPRLSGKF